MPQPKEPPRVSLIILDSVTQDYKRRKAELDPTVRARIVQWARATGHTDAGTGTRLPYALSYIQDWWIEDDTVAIVFSEQASPRIEKTHMPARFLDNAEFKQYVYGCYEAARNRIQREADNQFQATADELSAAIKEII